MPSCHTSTRAMLGLKTHQLNGDLFYRHVQKPTSWKPGTTGTSSTSPCRPWTSFCKARPLERPDRERRGLRDGLPGCQLLGPTAWNGVVQGPSTPGYSTPLDQKGLVNEPTIGMNSPRPTGSRPPAIPLGSELWVRDSRLNGVNTGSMPPGKALVHDAHGR